MRLVNYCKYGNPQKPGCRKLAQPVNSEGSGSAYFASAWFCGSSRPADATLQLPIASHHAGQATFGAPADHACTLAVVVAVLAASFVAACTAVGQPSLLGTFDEGSFLPLERPAQAPAAAIRHLSGEGIHSQDVNVRIVC